MTLNKEVIRKSIRNDINQGVYAQFPQLLRKLEAIEYKCYIINAYLTVDDMRVLKENDYLS